MNVHQSIDRKIDYEPDFNGFINYMLHNNKISDMQKQDLIEAKTVLCNGMSHAFAEYDNQKFDLFDRSRKNKIIAMGDSRDAISIENVKIGFDITKKTNNLILNDNNFNIDNCYNEPKTNFQIMAMAQVDTNKFAGLQRKEEGDKNKNVTENIAYGYGHCPEIGWYYEELQLFNKIKSDLGIDNIYESKGLKQIQEEALRRQEEIGHYISLFRNKNTINAAGYNQYGNYGNTSVYIAKDLDYDHICSYSVDEMSEMLDRYLENIV